MVAIPAGSYRIGADTASSEAVKSRSISIGAFFIDTFEVTNAQYGRFIDVAGAPIPSGWIRGRIPDGKDSHPVVGVAWDWAEAYCAALSKRLPGDAEWEAVERGTNSKLYRPISHIEGWVPWVFFTLHLIVLIQTFAWCANLGFCKLS